MIARAAFAALVLAPLAACHSGPTNDLPDAGVSPQAKAEPAPLENVVPASSARALATDAGPPPVPLRPDEEAPADPIASGKELAGWSMDAVLRTAEIPPAFRGPETAITAVDAVKKKTELRLAIDLTSSRARVVLEGSGFTLPDETELRARADRYGLLVLLPGTREYHVAASGSLRVLLGERRIDVEPLMVPSVTERGEGARRLGYRTRRVEVANRAATAVFEVAHVADVGEGGALLCRAFLDLLNAPPSTTACDLDDVPLHVEWHWPTKGSLTFEALSFVRRTDLAASNMAAPPPGTSFAPPALPESGTQLLVDTGDIVAFRTAAAADVPPAPTDASAPAARSGLTLANASDELRFAWLDGAPIAWLAPGTRVALPSLLRGRYGFEWRTFLGDAYDAPITINVPGAQSTAPDAGAP